MCTYYYYFFVLLQVILYVCLGSAHSLFVLSPNGRFSQEFSLCYLVRNLRCIFKMCLQGFVLYSHSTCCGFVPPRCLTRVVVAYRCFSYLQQSTVIVPIEPQQPPECLSTFIVGRFSIMVCELFCYVDTLKILLVIK